MCSFFTLLNVPVDKKVNHIDKRRKQGARPGRAWENYTSYNTETHASQKNCSLFQRRYNQLKEITISGAVPYIPETSDTNRSPLPKKKKGEEGGKENKKREKRGREVECRKRGLKHPQHPPTPERAA